jgi:hypothetical protein
MLNLIQNLEPNSAVIGAAMRKEIEDEENLASLSKSGSLGAEQEFEFQERHRDIKNRIISETKHSRSLYDLLLQRVKRTQQSHLSDPADALTVTADLLDTSKGLQMPAAGMPIQ